METKRGRDAQDEAPRPTDGEPTDAQGTEGTATGSPKRDDCARAVEVEDLNSANDAGSK